MTTYKTGFELGPAGTAIPTTGVAGDGDSFSAGGNGTTGALVSDQTAGTVADGAYSAKLTVGATAGVLQRSWTIADTATPSFRTYLYLPAAPSAAWDVFAFVNAGTIVSRFRISPGLALVHINGATAAGTTTGTLPLNTLVRIEGTWGLSTTATGTFTVDAYLGHSTTPIADCSLSLTGLTFSAATANTARFGVVNSSATNLTAYLDAVGASDTGRLGPATVPLAAPTGLAATAVSSTANNVTWNAAIGATGYDVERGGVIVATGHPATTYSDTGLTPATPYSYRVRSTN